MYVTANHVFIVVLATLASTVEPAAVQFTKRAPTYIGWHASTAEKMKVMQEAGTLVFQGNSEPGKNQLGDGIYLAEKLGDYGSDDKVVCLFAADAAKLTTAEKVKYPDKNRDGKQIQWMYSNDDHQKLGQFSRAFFDDIKADRKKALRISKWDNGVQLMIPETMVGTAGNTANNPLGVTIIECAPFKERDSMKNKDVVVDFTALPGTYKGWFAGETPPPAAGGTEGEACNLNGRAVNSAQQGCSRPSATPVQSNAQSAAQSPAQTPAQTPAKSLAQTPAKTPVQTPVNTPAKTPVQSPAKSPAKTPVQAPVKTPVKPPVQTPVRAPVKTAATKPKTRKV